MKPDKIVCQNCGKQIPKGKWCSDKCRKAYGRNSDNSDIKVGQKSDKPSIKSDKIKSDTDILASRTELDVRPKLTKTDKTFYDRAMKDFGEPYYNFDDKARELKCAWCGKPFTTHLSMNRYCSFAHYKEAISAFRG